MARSSMDELYLHVWQLHLAENANRQSRQAQIEANLQALERTVPSDEDEDENVDEEEEEGDVGTKHNDSSRRLLLLLSRLLLRHTSVGKRLPRWLVRALNAIEEVLEVVDLVRVQV
eukprot:jgi/Chlat1/913/Chrsp108S01355